jgi:hypothetical protein
MRNLGALVRVVEVIGLSPSGFVNMGDFIWRATGFRAGHSNEYSGIC